MTVNFIAVRYMMQYKLRNIIIIIIIIISCVLGRSQTH